MKAILLSVLSLSLFANPTLLEKLENRREIVKSWALECSDGSYSEHVDECYQNDVTLFAGLGCLGAVLADDKESIKKRCDDVKNAQGSNGRWWRGVTRVDDGRDNSFSRDMARGVHAYLIAKGHLNKDLEEKEEVKKSATNWFNWIMSDEADEKLCTIFTSNRCRITIGARNLFYNTFGALGVMPQGGGLARKVRKSGWYLKNLFYVETMVTETGFPRHLKASSLLMYRVLNMKDGKIKDKKIERKMKKVAKFLHKNDKENALMNFFNNGVTTENVDQVLSQCPVNLPNAEINRRDFQWQRTTSQGVIDRTDGHDCIYLMNLMIAKLKGNLYW
jgi:arsenate reductase-like glutaredoxin family protein